MIKPFALTHLMGWSIIVFYFALYSAWIVYVLRWLTQRDERKMHHGK